MSDSGDRYAGIVESLVTQFSSSLDCLRELVQNAIDAGTPRVEVWMEFTPGVGREGSIAIHVDDFGEGMDEAIIDNQLTQLFSSSKDNDLTKIGKFGIGFVSVFALNPRAVLVHTGKNGEYWEILFGEDRSFLKTRLQVPVEGTQITLFLSGDFVAYQKLVQEVPRTLRHWCNHSDVEITFEDRYEQRFVSEPELINAPFEVAGDCMQRIVHQGTEIVMAYNLTPIYGFYNRGLTLALTQIGDDVLGRRHERYRHISFKIKSRYLEHTLARETIMRDEQYEKAMVLLDEGADGVLLDGLFARLEALVKTPRWDVTQLAEYGRLLRYLREEPDGSLRRGEKRMIIRLVDGSACSLADLFEAWKRHRQVLMSDGADELNEKLQKAGRLVVLGTTRQAGGGVNYGLDVVRHVILRSLSLQRNSTLGGSLWNMVNSLGLLPARKNSIGESSVENPAEIYFPVALDEQTPEAIAPLLLDVERLLVKCDIGYRRLRSAVMLRTVSQPPLFVVAAKLGDLMVRPENMLEDPELERKPAAGARHRREVAVNRDHPRFQEIFAVYRHDAEMGTYMLAKALLLEENYRLDLDAKLMRGVLQTTAAQYLQDKDEVRS